MSLFDNNIRNLNLLIKKNITSKLTEPNDPRVDGSEVYLYYEAYQKALLKLIHYLQVQYEYDLIEEQQLNDVLEATIQLLKNRLSIRSYLSLSERVAGRAYPKARTAALVMFFSGLTVFIISLSLLVTLPLSLIVTPLLSFTLLFSLGVYFGSIGVSKSANPTSVAKRVIEVGEAAEEAKRVDRSHYPLFKKNRKMIKQDEKEDKQDLGWRMIQPVFDY